MRSLVDQCGRFHGYVRTGKIALTLSVTVHLRGPLPSIRATRSSLPVRVADCVRILRIDGINVASTTGNNVGTSSSFKHILAPGFSRTAVAVETSFLSKVDCV